jgi:plastocyanin
MRALTAGLVAALFLLAGCSDSGDDGGDGTPDGGPSVTGGATAGSGATTGTGGSSATGGTGGGGSGAGTETTLAVSAVGAYPVNPAFDPATVSVAAGTLVHVTFTNEDVLPIQHNWVVAGINGASSDTVGSGEQSTFDFTAPPVAGTFVFYCSIGDHRDRGMEGSLTVTA